MKYPIGFVWITLIFLSFPLSSSAQTTSYSVTPSPYSNEYVRGVFESNTISATSRDSLESIPKSELYKQVFRLISLKPQVMRSLSASDQQVIRNLPSHRAAQFSTPERLRQAELCQSYDAERVLGTTDVVAFANWLERDRQAHFQLLEDHYDVALNKLSAYGIRVVNEEISQLTVRMSLTYSTVDMVGIAESAPLIAMQVLDNYCTQALIMSEVEYPDDEKLLDVFGVSIPINGSAK